MQRWRKRVKPQYHCVGCGSPVAWDGKALFSYTCPCGAVLFADQNGKLAIPYSLIKAMKEHMEPCHIDYYLGKSNYMSMEKLKAIEMLRRLGARWSWQCPECKPKVVERTFLELKQGFYHFEVHPELKKLIQQKGGRERNESFTSNW